MYLSVAACRKRDTKPFRLPREVLKSVKRRKVRRRIKHFLKKSVPVSSVLFLWLPVANYGLSSLLMKKSLFLLDFFKQNLNKKSVGLLVGIINVIQNFFPSSI